MSPSEHFVSEESRWQAVGDRNREADGAFVYAVVTTGIYCRPGCSSRLPNRQNVRFFDGWQQAEESGYRPCKRCRPNSNQGANQAADPIAHACRLIEEADQELTLRQLADAVGLSKYHFQRLFKKIVGVTPKQYAMQRRLNYLQKALPAAGSVTEAIYEAGFGSSSSFYGTATASLGMKPAAWRKGGADMIIRYAMAETYLGWVLIAATERGICRIDFDDTPERLRARLHNDFPAGKLVDDDPEFAEVVEQVVGFLAAPEEGLNLPLDVQGTAFQRRVWAALRTIPVGTTASYGEIAHQIDAPKAGRAVAQACAANRIAVAIPCHRVVRGDGSLGGYRWGTGRKQAILDREAAARDNSVDE